MNMPPAGILRFAGGRSVLAQLDPSKHAEPRAKLEAALKNMDRRHVGSAWNAATGTPFYDVVVATKAAPEKLFEKTLPGMGLDGGPTVAFYFDDILAAGYELSGDRLFLERLSEMHGGKLDRVDPGGGNSAHAAWLLQRLAAKR